MFRFSMPQMALALCAAGLVTAAWAQQAPVRDASVGEMVEQLKKQWGEFVEPVKF